MWLKNQQIPGLAMSRSICDTVAKQAGCISTPEVFEVDLGADVRFIVLASDGLWEFMSNQEVRCAFFSSLWSSLRMIGGGRDAVVWRRIVYRGGCVRRGWEGGMRMPV